MLGTAPLGSAPIADAPALVLASASESDSQLWLLSPRDSDEATVTASSEVTALPASNVQGKDPRQVSRSQGLLQTLTFSFAEPVACNALAANGLDTLLNSAPWRVRGADTLAGLASPVVNTGWQSVFAQGNRPVIKDWRRYGSLLRWTNEAALGFWAVDVADPGNPLGYIDLGRVALGRELQPSRNYDQSSMPLAYDQRDVQTITAYGNTLTDRREKSARRRFALNFSAMDEVDAEEGVAEVQRLRGMWGDIFICLDPTETGAAFQRGFAQAVFVDRPSYNGISYFNENGQMYSTSLSLREV